MSIITFQCYSCHSVLKVGADKAGKKAKCRCGTILTIPAAAEEAVSEAPQPAAAPKRSAKTALADEPPFDDDEAPPKKSSKLRNMLDAEDDGGSPSRNGRARDDDEDDEPPRRRRRDEDDDDLDDEDRPRKKRRGDDDEDDDDRPAKKRRRDEDDDEVDEDRPKKKRSRDDDDDLDDEDRPAKKRRRDEDDDLDDEDRPRKKRRGGDDEDDDDRPAKKRRRDEDDDLDDEDRPRKKRRRDEDDDDDYDDRRRRKGKGGGGGWTDAWPRVRLGFLLAFIGTLVYAGGFGLDALCDIIGAIMSMAGSTSSGLFQTLSVLSKIAVLVALGGLITTVVGFVFWIFVTNKNAGLAFAIATLATGAIYSIMYLIFKVIPTYDPRSVATYTSTIIILSILLGGFMAGTWIMAAFYIKSVGKSLKDRSLTGSFMLLLIMASVAAGLEGLRPILLLPFRPSFEGPRDFDTIQAAVRTFNIVNLILLILAVGAQVFQLVLFVLAFRRARNTTDV